MNKFRKFALAVIIFLCFVIVGLNAYVVTKWSDSTGRIHRVEAKRLAREMSLTTATDVIEDIDLSKYYTIVRVSIFNEDDICNNDYVVENVNGTLYRIEYREHSNQGTLIILNAVLFGVLIFTVLLFVYIQRKILKPFADMTVLTTELAKGNLSVPVKEEKSRYFGKFLWGMDMLRENLEESKEKELEYQKEKKTLILSLSHDIKTPLSAIELYNKALSKGLYDTDEKKQEVYAGIEKNIGDIRKYVEEITNASREDFLNLQVREGEFYLANVMDKITSYYGDKLAGLHTEFVVDTYSNVLLKGDEDRITEVLQNVMENAIKYGDGKKVAITFSEEEDYRLIHIANTGTSIEEEEMLHLFDSFYRGKNSKNIKGSGLGLYICKTLMRMMEGEIYAESEGDMFAVVVVIKKV